MEGRKEGGMEGMKEGGRVGSAREGKKARENVNAEDRLRMQVGACTRMHQQPLRAGQGTWTWRPFMEKDDDCTTIEDPPPVIVWSGEREGLCICRAAHPATCARKHARTAASLRANVRVDA